MSNLLSSNLEACFFNRFVIHTARDRPDTVRAPPAATPEATAATLAGGAVETL